MNEIVNAAKQKLNELRKQRDRIIERIRKLEDELHKAQSIK